MVIFLDFILDTTNFKFGSIFSSPGFILVTYSRLNVSIALSDVYGCKFIRLIINLCRSVKCILFKNYFEDLTIEFENI